MGTLEDKLTYLSGTKTAIKNAIIAKGVNVGENDTFRSYASKIGDIETGSQINVESLSVTENGTYTAESGSAYSPVYVNVSPDIERLDVTENGTYSASGDGYDPVVVNVQPDLERLDVTENGTYTPTSDGYNLVTVNVPKATYTDNDGNVHAVDFQKDQSGNVELDGDGNPITTDTESPASIDITTNPTKYYYNSGETIDFTGGVVKAYHGDGTLFDDTSTPNGVVNNSDLVFSPAKATPDGTPTQTTETRIICDSEYLFNTAGETIATIQFFTETRIYTKKNYGDAFGAYIYNCNNSGRFGFYPILISPIPDYCLIKQDSYDSATATPFEYNGNTLYYCDYRGIARSDDKKYSNVGGRAITYDATGKTLIEAIKELLDEHATVVTTTVNNYITDITTKYVDPISGVTLTDTFEITVSEIGSHSSGGQHF